MTIQFQRLSEHFAKPVSMKFIVANSFLVANICNNSTRLKVAASHWEFLSPPPPPHPPQLHHHHHRLLLLLLHHLRRLQSVMIVFTQFSDPQTNMLICCSNTHAAWKWTFFLQLKCTLYSAVNDEFSSSHPTTTSSSSLSNLARPSSSCCHSDIVR